MYKIDERNNRESIEYETINNESEYVIESKEKKKACGADCKCTNEEEIEIDDKYLFDTIDCGITYMAYELGDEENTPLGKITINKGNIIEQATLAGVPIEIAKEFEQKLKMKINKKLWITY